MAIALGQGGQVKVAVSGGTEAAVGNVRGFSLDYTNEVVETTVLAGLSTSADNTGKSFAKGLEASTFSVDCFFDEADAVQDIMKAGTAIDFELYPIATDGQMYSGAAIITSASISVTPEALVEVSFSANVNGALTVTDN
jgi:hypothetical protein